MAMSLIHSVNAYLIEYLLCVIMNLMLGYSPHYLCYFNNKLNRWIPGQHNCIWSCDFSQY